MHVAACVITYSYSYRLEKLESALKLQQHWLTERKTNKRNKVGVCKVILYSNLSPWNAQTMAGVLTG